MRGNGVIAGEGLAGSGRVPELRALIWCGVAVFVVAIALTVVVARADGPVAGDVRIARWVQDIIPTDGANQSIRNMNNTEAVALAGSIGAAGLWYSGRRQQALILGAGIVTLVLVTLGIKTIVDRERPDHGLINVTVIGRSASYPSGHAISSAMLYGYLAYIVAGAAVAAWLRWAALAMLAALAVASGVGTIHSGAHWPSDVAGGFLWAVVLVIAMVAVDRALKVRRERGVVGASGTAAREEAVGY